MTKVIIVAADKRNLNVLKEKMSIELEAGVADNVLFLLPEDLVTFLDQANASAKDTEQTVKGYKVKVKYKAVFQDQGTKIRKAISDVLVKAFRKQQA